MRVKSDSTLKYLLLEIHERAQSDNIAHAIWDILDHVGAQSPYRGGNQLLELLEFAKSEARAGGDKESFAGLTDALAYATGRMLDEDVSEKYALYSGSGQDSAIRSLTRMTSAMQHLAEDELQDFLQVRPNASVEDVQEHFSKLGKMAFRFVRSRRAGYYEAFRIRTEGSAWVTDVLTDRTTLRRDLGEDSNRDKIEALLEDDTGRLLLAAAQLRLRERKLAELRRVVENRYSKESHLQDAVSRNLWLFGGGFVSLALRRRFAMGTELDIPLLRPDGVLHVVELKRANVPLVKQYRSSLVPTASVNDAVAQVANYLRTLDECRGEILEDFGIDTRRASGTVVVGHPMFQPEFSESRINEAIRSCASHLTRIDVMSYKELVDNAERSLSMEELR